MRPAGPTSKRTARLGWQLIEERFDDEGCSGTTMARPALQHLLEAVRASQMDRVVVQRLDRLSRNLHQCVTLLKDLRDHRVGLVVVSAPEMGTAALDSLMLNVLASFAEFEREMIASRIAESRARLTESCIDIG